MKNQDICSILNKVELRKKIITKLQIKFGAFFLSSLLVFFVVGAVAENMKSYKVAMAGYAGMIFILLLMALQMVLLAVKEMWKLIKEKETKSERALFSINNHLEIAKELSVFRKEELAGYKILICAKAKTERENHSLASGALEKTGVFPIFLAIIPLALNIYKLLFDYSINGNKIEVTDFTIVFLAVFATIYGYLLLSIIEFRHIQLLDLQYAVLDTAVSVKDIIEEDFKKRSRKGKKVVVFDSLDSKVNVT